MGIRIVRDMPTCELLWKAHYPMEGLFDLWDVRACFARAFHRDPFFIVNEEKGAIKGLLPLCYIDEIDAFAFFPGETWHAKTWMEQNKIFASDESCLNAMIEAIPGKSHIRYVDAIPGSSMDKVFDLDEIGYLFLPKAYDYDYEQYLAEFSGKSRKKIMREIEKIKERGVNFRIDDKNDIAWVFKLNLAAFGEESYFHDPRFMEGFQNLIKWLDANDMLRVVTLLVDGEIAAVDIGAVYKNQCTLLAGGTHRDYPGVAKVINLFHMEWACSEKMEELDFLCGDFGWKERFKLFPRPLYVLNDSVLGLNHSLPMDERVQVHAA